MRVFQETQLATSNTIDRIPFGLGYRYTHSYTRNGKPIECSFQTGNRYQAALPNGWSVSVSNLASTWRDQWSLAVLDENGEFVQLPEWLPRALDGSPCLKCVEFSADEMDTETFARIYHAAAAATKGVNQC